MNPPREILVGVAADPGGRRGTALAAEDLRDQGIPVRLREAGHEAATSGIAAIALAREFDEAGVVAVVGYSASGAAISAAHLLNQRGIPMLIPSATSTLLTGVGPWVFRICATDRAQGELLAEHAHNRGYSRAGILYVLDDYGKGLAANFARSFGEKGGRVTLAVGYSSIMDRPSERLTAALMALRSARPEVLVLIARTRDLVELPGGRLLAEPGWPPTLGSDTAYAPLDAQGHDGLFEGMTVASFAPPDSVLARRFADRYRDRFGAAPDSASYASYDALCLLGQALRQGRSRDDIRRYLRRLGRGLPPFEGVTGPIRFDENGDSVDARLVMAKVRKGSLEVLDR